jgi:hypothetical protein
MLTVARVSLLSNRDNGKVLDFRDTEDYAVHMAIQRLHPTIVRVKSAVVRIFFIWLAAHLGAVLGRHLFFWAFNTADIVLSSYVSDWQKWIAYMLNPREAEFALEAAMMAYRSPWLLLLVVGTMTGCLLCLVKRKWKYLYVAVLVSFAALIFVTGLAWTL